MDYKNMFILKCKGMKLPNVVSFKTHSIENLICFLLENLDELKSSFIEETKISSVVMNDVRFIPDDGKRYRFVGSGCGFSSIIVDKRNKKAVSIVKDSSSIKRNIEDILIKSISNVLIQELEDCGNPIQAMLSQNLNYKIQYNTIVIRYMEKFGITKVSLRNFDD